MSHSLILSKALMAVTCSRVQSALSYIRGNFLGMSLLAHLGEQILSISDSLGKINVIYVRQIDLAHSLGLSRVSLSLSSDVALHLHAALSVRVLTSKIDDIFVLQSQFHTCHKIEFDSRKLLFYVCFSTRRCAVCWQRTTSLSHCINCGFLTQFK